jgi:hypothetical protein
MSQPVDGGDLIRSRDPAPLPAKMDALAGDRLGNALTINRERPAATFDVRREPAAALTGSPARFVMFRSSAVAGTIGGNALSGAQSMTGCSIPS